MSREQSESPLSRFGLPLLSFLVPLTLYSVTCCRDIFWDDTTELMLAGLFLKLPHPPGCPLLLMLLRLTTLVPVLSLPLRMNLVSSVFAAGSCLFTFLIARDITRNRLAALFAALAFGFSFELWTQATALEVYSFQAMLVAAGLWAVLRWTRSGRVGDLGLGWFIIGLGLANHLTALLWVPGLLALSFAGPWRSNPARAILPALGLFLLGPGLYLALPALAEPGRYAGWGGITGFGDLVGFVSGRIYRYRLLAGESGFIGSLPGLAGRQFLVSWLLVIPGIVALAREQRRLGLCLLLGAGLTLGFTLGYNIPDKQGYLLPVYLAAAVAVGLGFARLHARRPLAVALLALPVLLLPLILHCRQHDRSQLTGLRDLSAAVLAELPDSAVLFTDDYSVYHGVNFLQSEAGATDSRVAVSEFHLVFPWCLEHLSGIVPVPARAIETARQLWQQPEQGARFGEAASAAAADIKLLVAAALADSRPVHWLPRDFADWPSEWRGVPLRLTGLTYRLLDKHDSLPPLPEPALPSPERYSTSLYLDPETQDVCRRFAAAANRRGIIRYGRGDIAAALEDFDLALEYFPDYPSPVENKGILFFFEGPRDSARFYLSRFLELAPASPEAPKVRDFLRELGN